MMYLFKSSCHQGISDMKIMSFFVSDIKAYNFFAFKMTELNQ